MSVVGNVTSLVDKSMIVLVDPGTSRYRLLEPLREFGLDHLRSRGALEETEDRHLTWFLDLAERGALGLDSPDEAVGRLHSNAITRNWPPCGSPHGAPPRRCIQGPSTCCCAARASAFRHVNYEITSWADTSTALEAAQGDPGLSSSLAVSAYGRFVRGDMQNAVDLAASSARHLRRLRSLGEWITGTGARQRSSSTWSRPRRRCTGWGAWSCRRVGQTTRGGSRTPCTCSRSPRRASETRSGVRCLPARRSPRPTRRGHRPLAPRRTMRSVLRAGDHRSGRGPRSSAARSACRCRGRKSLDRGVRADRGALAPSDPG